MDDCTTISPALISFLSVEQSEEPVNPTESPELETSTTFTFLVSSTTTTGPTTDPVTFNIDVESMAHFGPWRHGDVVKSTRGRDEGNQGVIIGVRNGYLWRCRRGLTVATAYSAWDAKTLDSKYGLVKVGFEEVEPVALRSREDLPTLLITRVPEVETRQLETVGHPFVYYLGADLKTTTLDIHVTVMSPFKVSHGDRIICRSGQTSVVIGVFDKGLWVHDESDNFPRQFDLSNEFREIVGETSLRDQREHKFTYAYREYECHDEHLKERYGYIRGARLRHTAGPHRDLIGTVIGERDNMLYEVFGDSPLNPQPLGSTKREIDELHRVIVVGLYCGKMRTPSKSSEYAFPCQTGNMNFDIRPTATMAFNCHHGQAVLIFLGPMHGTVARVVGVREGQVWAVADWEAGCFCLEPSTYRILPRPLVSLINASFYNPRREIESSLPTTISSLLMQTESEKKRIFMPRFVQRPACGGQMVTFDMSHEVCSLFRVASGQMILLGIHEHFTEEASKTFNPLCSSWLELQYPAGWYRCVVVGVFRDELWVCKYGEYHCFPLKGSNGDALRVHNTWDVKGFTRLDPMYDPFLPPDAVPCPSFFEYGVQDEKNVAILVDAKTQKSIAVDTSPEAFEYVRCGHLKKGDVIQYKSRGVTRVKTRVCNKTFMKEKQFEHETKIYYTVGGVCGSDIYFIDEEEQLKCIPAAQVRSEQPLLASSLPPTLVEKWSNKKLVAAEVSGEYLPPNAQCVPEDILQQHLSEVTKTQMNEMEYKFTLLPKGALFEAYIWVLSFYNVGLRGFEHHEHALRKLVVVETVTGQDIVSPTFEQWFRHTLVMVEEEETKERDTVEYEYKDANYFLTYKAADLFKQWQCEQDIQKTPVQKPSRRSVAELVKMTLQFGTEETPRHRTMSHSTMSNTSFMSSISHEIVPENSSFSKKVLSPSSTGSRKCDLIKNEMLSEAVATVEWPWVYISQGLPLIFDISPEACKAFGLKHGMEVEYTYGDTKGQKAHILGVYKDKLWRYDVRNECIYAFDGTTRESIYLRHGLNVVGTRNLRRSDPFYFHTDRGDWVPFDVCADLLTQCKVAYGERYFVTRGPLQGRVLVIIGVFDRQLWYAVDWSGAFAYNQSAPVTEIVNNFGLQFLYCAPVRTILQMPKNTAYLFPTNAEFEEVYDVSFETCRPFGALPGQKVRHARQRDGISVGTIIGVRRGYMCQQTSNGRFVVQIDCPAHKLAESAMELLSWTRPPYSDLHIPSARSHVKDRIRFLSSSGHVCIFDTSESLCWRLFGFYHEEAVTYVVQGVSVFGTIERRAQATIVGVREGYLWKCDTGESYATIFHGCRNAADLRTVWKVTSLGKRLPLTECTG